MIDASCDGFFPLKTGHESPRQEGAAEGRSVPFFCASSAPNLRQCAAGNARKARETSGSVGWPASP